MLVRVTYFDINYELHLQQQVKEVKSLFEKRELRDEVNRLRAGDFHHFKAGQ